MELLESPATPPLSVTMQPGSNPPSPSGPGQEMPRIASSLTAAIVRPMNSQAAGFQNPISASATKRGKTLILPPPIPTTVVHQQ